MTDVQPSLDHALNLFRRGDAAAAREAAAAALQRTPEDGRLLHFLGSLSCHTGALAEGADYLRRALQVNPGDVASRVNLVRALIDMGESDEALQLCSATPAAHVELSRMRGHLLQAQGRNEEAVAAYEAVVTERPGDWEIWNNLGNARRALGDATGAVDALGQAAAHKPEIPAIHINLASAFADAGDLESALGAYRRAFELVPGDIEIRLEMARILRDLRRFKEALDLLRRGRSTPEELVEMGRNYSALWSLEDAEKAYRGALAQKRDFAEAWLELGIVVERAGRIEDVEPVIAEARIAGIEEDRLAYLRALLLQRQGRIEEALEWAQRAPVELDPARTQRLIAKLADKAGRPDLSFAAAAESNRIAARERPGSYELAAAYREQVAALSRVVTESWYAGWSPAPPPSKRPAPAFLVGFPRSGTTLLDTLLMGHPATHVLEEVPLLDRVMTEIGDLERIATFSADEIEHYRGVYFAALDETNPPESATLVVDKLPLNILGAPLIHRLFPEARFILALRHPCDVAISCFMQDFELNKAMANFLDIRDTAVLYDQVFSFWEACRNMMPLDVFEVRYETLVADAESVMRPLAGFLGLEWNDGILDHERTAAARGTISTPSYNQVTQRLYSESSGRWQRYREQLEPVLPVLLPWAERLGYDD